MPSSPRTDPSPIPGQAGPAGPGPTPGGPDTRGHQSSRRWTPGRVLVLVLGCCAVLGQLWGLYAPDQPEAPAGWWAELPLDKFVHFGMFSTPVFFFRLAGIRGRILVLLFGAHAVVSELIQGFFLPHRSGDPLDALTDLCAVLVGLGAALLVLRIARRGPGRRTRQGAR